MLKVIKQLSSMLKVSWIIFGIFIILIIGLEVISSFYFNYNKKVDSRAGGYPDKERIWTKEYFQELASVKTEWRSYNYWRAQPLKGKYINIDQNGIRRTAGNKIASGSGAPGSLKIFMFGGSVLWGLGPRDDYTIPSYVAKILHDKGISAQVTNFGQLGYVSTQEMIELILQLRNNNIPDVVVFVDGVNDCYSILQGSAPGMPKNEYNRVDEFNLLLRPYDIPKELLIRSDVFKFAKMMLPKIIQGRPKKSFTKDDYPKIANDAVDIYLQNLKIINSILKMESDKNILSLFYWQPSVFFKQKRSPYEEQQYVSSKQFEKIFTTADEKIKPNRSLYKDNNLLNISGIFIDHAEPIFIDMCHLNEEGNKIIGSRIADDIQIRIRRDRSESNITKVQ